MKFRSDNPDISDAYEKKRHLPVIREFKPASTVCDHCWGRDTCLRRTAMGNPSKTCCVWTYFQTRASTSVEDMIQYTCGVACVARQKWEYDHVPHDSNYCDKDCPVSLFLREKPASDYETR